MLTEKPLKENDQCNCSWTSWMNNDFTKTFGNDNNSYEMLRKEGHVFCEKPISINCRDHLNPKSDFELVRQRNVECDVTNGLVCDYKWGKYCKDYELRVFCCQPCQTEKHEVTTNSYFINTNNNLSDIKDNYDSRNYIEINENWIPALIIFFLMFMMTSSIVLYLFKHRGKQRNKNIKINSRTKNNYPNNKFFNFANFSHNFEAKLESNRSDLQLITPSSGGDYDASAVFSVNHDDVITYTTSVACSETQASSSVVDPLERVRRSLKKSEPPRVPEKFENKFEEFFIQNDDSGIADVDMSDLNIEDCVKNIQSLLNDDDKSKIENEIILNNVIEREDLNKSFNSDGSFSSLVSQQNKL